MKTWLYLKQCGMFIQSSHTTSCQNTILGSYDLWFPHQCIPYGTWSHIVWKIHIDISDNLSWWQSCRFLCNTDTSTTQHSIASKGQLFIYLPCTDNLSWWQSCRFLRNTDTSTTQRNIVSKGQLFIYLQCNYKSFTCLDKNTRHHSILFRSSYENITHFQWTKDASVFDIYQDI